MWWQILGRTVLLLLSVRWLRIVAIKQFRSVWVTLLSLWFMKHMVELLLKLMPIFTALLLHSLLDIALRTSRWQT
jgi:hypothetical protein